MDGPQGFPDFSDAPLFREMERVLRSGSGPVNWELARQVAVAVAPAGPDEPAPGPQDDSLFEQAVRIAELQVAETTGLTPPSGIATAQAIRRHEWVESTVATLTGCVEPAAKAMAAAFGDAMPEAAGSMAMFREQIGSLLLGAQAGTAIGQRSANALAAWDLVVPPVGIDHLRFVAPNLGALAIEDPIELRQWVALREVALRFVFARPWLRERFVATTTDFASSIRTDTSQLRERMEGLDPSNPEAMQSLLSGEDPAFSIQLDDEGRIKLARVQALAATIDGYAEHIRQRVGDRLLTSGSRLEEAVREPSAEADPVFGLFGVEFTAEHRHLGRDFCDHVALDAGSEALARMWDDPESAPSMVELEEPMLWMARSL
jgi:putative hydrolase